MEDFILATFNECWYRCKVCGKGRPPRAFPKKKPSLSGYLNLYPKKMICIDCHKELEKGKIIYKPEIAIDSNYIKY